MRTSDSLLFTILRSLHINRLYRAVEGYLPSWANATIQNVTLKNIFIPLVEPEEIMREYKNALEYLILNIGATRIGDYLEFGVSYGTSLSCMHQATVDVGLKDMRLLGFDSFKGMPESASSEESGKWKPGEFASPIENTKKLLAEHGVQWNRTFLIEGWFKDTLSAETVGKYSIEKASLIMVDCDLYSSARQALNFCVPFIKDSAIVLFDDWFNDKNFGEDRAFDEFLRENPQFSSTEFGSYEPTGRSFLITNNGSTGHL